MFLYCCKTKVFHINFRSHPRIREVDTVHARDFSRMNLNQVSSTMAQSKKRDGLISKQMQ